VAQAVEKAPPGQPGLRAKRPDLTLNVSYGAGRQVTLYGQVTGMSGVTVLFRGSVKGSATTDADGNYSLTTNARILGEVEAATADGSSNTASVILSGGPPVIGDFEATQQGNTNYWTITGHVTDGNFSAQGLTVHINGSPVTVDNSGQGRKVTVGDNGNFLLRIRLNGTSSDNGVIHAQTTDLWGYKSNERFATIRQPGT
jgi:hypothetical protein